jgi:hypothetical protein
LKIRASPTVFPKLKVIFNKNRSLYFFILRQIFYILCALQRVNLVLHLWLAISPEYQDVYFWISN